MDRRHIAAVWRAKAGDAVARAVTVAIRAAWVVTVAAAGSAAVMAAVAPGALGGK